MNICRSHGRTCRAGCSCKQGCTTSRSSLRHNCRTSNQPSSRRRRTACTHTCPSRRRTVRCSSSRCTPTQHTAQHMSGRSSWGSTRMHLCRPLRSRTCRGCCTRDRRRLSGTRCCSLCRSSMRCCCSGTGSDRRTATCHGCSDREVRTLCRTCQPCIRCKMHSRPSCSGTGRSGSVAARRCRGCCTRTWRRRLARSVWTPDTPSDTTDRPSQRSTYTRRCQCCRRSMFRGVRACCGHTGMWPHRDTQLHTWRRTNRTGKRTTRPSHCIVHASCTAGMRWSSPTRCGWMRRSMHRSLEHLRCSCRARCTPPCPPDRGS
eukprot:PhM_4_TR18074/c1_g1_i1/m.44539